jgi:CheY-like chemotaxis protein
MEYAGKELLGWQIDEVDVSPSLKNLKVMIVAGEETAGILAENLSAWGAQPEVLEPEKAVGRLASAFGRQRPYRFAFLEMPLFEEQEREKLRKLAAKPGFPSWSLILLGPGGTTSEGSALVENALTLEQPVDSDRLKERIGQVLAKPQIGKAALHPRNARRVKKQEQGTQVLVADHSANTRMLIKYFLNDRDFVVDMAETPQEALKKYQANNYDIVVMGMEFPDNGGYEVVESIRAWEREVDLPGRPIIALIPQYENDGAKRSVASGCSATLIKPVTKENLGNVISHYLTMA